jgi:hypothetical protein
MVLVARRSVRTGLLALLVVVAALVRIWGLRFGLPHTECRPDESVIVTLAEQFWSGDLNPRIFRYPTLQMYLTATAFGADYVQGRVRGIYPSVSGYRQAMIEDARHPRRRPHRAARDPHGGGPLSSRQRRHRPRHRPGVRLLPSLTFCTCVTPTSGPRTPLTFFLT